MYLSVTKIVGSDRTGYSVVQGELGEPGQVMCKGDLKRCEEWVKGRGLTLDTPEPSNGSPLQRLADALPASTGGRPTATVSVLSGDVADVCYLLGGAESKDSIVADSYKQTHEKRAGEPIDVKPATIQHLIAATKKAAKKAPAEVAA